MNNKNNKSMKSNKSSGTIPEILLGKAMFARGLRYRKNNKTVYGKPDFTFKSLKLAIFVDGEFWHGKNWEQKKMIIKQTLHFGQKK